jgi:hypothetical protein
MKAELLLTLEVPATADLDALLRIWSSATDRLLNDDNWWTRCGARQSPTALCGCADGRTPQRAAVE